MALLTLAEARALVETSLGDVALQKLIDAAEAIITDAIGPVGTVSEVLTAGPGDLIMLSRRAISVTSVVENDVTLGVTDYELYSTGRLLHRKELGAANPGARWRGRVLITYTPVSDVAQRVVAAAALIKLDVDYDSNAGSERIGDWTETFRTDTTYLERRDEILAGLGSSFVLQ